MPTRHDGYYVMRVYALMRGDARRVTARYYARYAMSIRHDAARVTRSGGRGASMLMAIKYDMRCEKTGADYSVIVR